MAAARALDSFGGTEGLTEELQGEWRDGGFTFVQLADTQLGLMESFKKAGWGATDLRPDLSPAEAYLQEVAASRAAVEAINAMPTPPLFAIICGDLVNAFPSDAEEQSKQFRDLAAIFSGVRKEVTLVCVCGNHDVGDAPSPATIQRWRDRFGMDYCSFWAGGCKCLVLNTQLYKDASQAKELAAEQDAWLTAELAKASTRRAKHLLVFSHIPPFISDPDEASGYFPLAKEARLDLLTRLAAAGASHWFCGHYHRNAGGVFRPEGADGGGGATLEVVTTAAIGTNITSKEGKDPLSIEGIGAFALDDTHSGLRIVTVTADAVTHEYKTLEALQK